MSPFFMIVGIALFIIAGARIGKAVIHDVPNNEEHMRTYRIGTRYGRFVASAFSFALYLILHFNHVTVTF
jgi:hypothetical protein